MYQLYYYPDNASFAPHLVLTHLGVPFELVLVDRTAAAQKSADYLKLNPAGRIPTLVDGDLVVFESPAICVYLAEQHPESSLVPPVGHPSRAKFLQWMMYLTNTLQADYMVYRYPEKHTSEPAGAAAISTAQASRLDGIFDLLEAEIADRDYLVGDQLSVCDYFLFMMCLWSSDKPFAPQSRPGLARYLRQLAATDIVRQVCKREDISLDAFA